jgi:hypothetical protein
VLAWADGVAAGEEAFLAKAIVMLDHANAPEILVTVRIAVLVPLSTVSQKPPKDCPNNRRVRCASANSSQ